MKRELYECSRLLTPAWLHSGIPPELPGPDVGSARLYTLPTTLPALHCFVLYTLFCVPMLCPPPTLLCCTFYFMWISSTLYILIPPYIPLFIPPTLLCSALYFILCPPPCCSALPCTWASGQQHCTLQSSAVNFILCQSKAYTLLAHQALMLYTALYFRIYNAFYSTLHKMFFSADQTFINTLP